MTLTKSTIIEKISEKNNQSASEAKDTLETLPIHKQGWLLEKKALDTHRDPHSRVSRCVLDSGGI